MQKIGLSITTKLVLIEMNGDVFFPELSPVHRVSDQIGSYSEGWGEKEKFHFECAQFLIVGSERGPGQIRAAKNKNTKKKL